MPKNKRGEIYTPSDSGLSETLDGEYYLMHVCECAGFDDETREYFTRNQEKMVGSVVEVKANELFKDSGKMRHPRYLRVRYDKEPERCIWEDHIGSSEVTV
jgi:ATP-dependent DNA ligase